MDFPVFLNKWIIGFKPIKYIINIIVSRYGNTLQTRLGALMGTFSSINNNAVHRE